MADQRIDLPQAQRQLRAPLQVIFIGFLSSSLGCWHSVKCRPPVGGRG